MDIAYLCVMLKRIIAICLLVALISSNFSRFFVYAGFELNKKYIISALCENRDKPWLHCDGNCYFMKKMKQVQEKEKSQQRELQQKLTQEICMVSATTVKFPKRLLQVVQTPYRAMKTVSLHTPLFRPPKLA